MDSTKIPRGIQRDPYSAATPPRPVPTRSVSHQPLTAKERLSQLTTPRSNGWADSDFANDEAIARKARRIALTATEQIDQGALIGYPSLDPAYAAYIETVIFYAAREAMES